MPNPGLTIEQMNEAISAFDRFGSVSEAADFLGINRTTFNSRVKRAKEYFGHKPEKPKILFYDLETSYNFGAFFEPIYEARIPPENVLLPSFMISAQWQWEGEEERHSVSLLDDMKRFKKNRWTFKDPFVDDYHVCKTIYDEICKADIIVAHNNDKFDAKKVNNGILKHGFKPLHRVQSVDTLKEARKHFKLASNSLDYLAGVLNVPKKRATSKSMFLRASLGYEDAIQETVDYGLDDIPPLRGVYYKLRSFMKSHPNMNVYMDDGRCPVCSSPDILEDKDYITRTSRFPGYRCSCCNHYFTHSKRISGAKFK